MKFRATTWSRISVLTRAGFLGTIILGALWPTYLNLVYAYNNARLVGLSHGSVWQQFYQFVQSVDGHFAADHTLSTLFVGTPSSMTVFGVTFIDPIMALSVLIASPGAIAGIVLGLVAVIASAMIFGRGYCTFGCPASLLFTANARIRDKVESIFPSLVEFRRALPRGLRYGILIGGTAAAVMSGMWVWSLLLPYMMVSTQLVNLVIGVPLGLTFFVLVSILAADLLVFPGEFCRAACPLGLVLGRLSSVALIRVGAEKRECPDGCDSCLVTCDLSLDPSDGAVADCNLCGRCISVCPSKKLSIQAGLPGAKSRVVIAVATMLFLFIAPSSASAHHYHGLPHYGYFDNYPQTPTEEYITSDGRWEMNFTLYNFQGMQREDVNQPDDVQIFIVIFDLKDKTTYGGKAKIEVHSKDNLVAKWSQEAEQESIFLINAEIPNPEDLTLTVDFADPTGKPITLSSSFQLPGHSGGRPLVWIGFGLLFLVAMLVFAGKQRRPVRKKTKAEKR